MLLNPDSNSRLKAQISLWSPMGPHGSGPNWPPWALTGRALMGPIGPDGMGPHGSPWALVSQALVGSPWALMGQALVSPLGTEAWISCVRPEKSHEQSARSQD